MGELEIGKWIMGIVAALIIWFGRKKFNQVEELDNRLSIVETRLDVLGDIKDALYHVKTDVEVIKSRLETLHREDK